MNYNQVKKNVLLLLRSEDYTLVKSNEVDCYMCNHERAVEKCRKPILDLGNSEGLPYAEDGVYHSVNDVAFQPFVYGPYEENAEICQEFILLYGLHKRVVDNKVVAYCRNVEDCDEEDVVIFDDSGYKVKTTYLVDFLKLKNRSLLFDLEFYVEEVEDVNYLVEEIKHCGVEVVLNNYPYLNCRYIFQNM